MIKAGAKRRRTRVELEEARQEESLREEGRNRQQQQIEELQAQIRRMQEDTHNNQAAANILNSWIEEGSVLQADDGSIVLAGQHQMQHQ